MEAQIERSAAPAAVLDAVAFADADHGWAAGKGLILGTSDGGAQWAPQYQGPADVTSLDVAGATYAWGVSSAGLLRTTDGGAEWTILPEPAEGTLTQVDFVSAAAGFGVASAGLVQTADGGQTWAALPPVDPPPAATSARASSAAPASAAPSVASSSNSSTPQTPSGPLPISAVCFSTASDGWAAANPAPGPSGAPEGEVLRTTDGGRNWTVSFDPYSGTVESVEQLRCAGQAAWVELGGDSGMMQHAYSVFRTEDGGATWSPVLTINTAGAGPGPGPTQGAAQGPGSAPGPLAVAGPAEAHFFGVVTPANCGPLQPVGTTDGGATSTTEPAVAGGYTCGVVGGYPAAAFVPGGHGWLVAGIGSSQSAIFATADGGRTWSEQYPSSALDPLEGLDFVSAAQGFGLGTLGDGAAILETVDGGRSWSRVGNLPESLAPGYGWISFANEQDGWAAAGYGTLLFTTSDGGARWTAVSLPPGTNSQSGALLSPRVGCLLDSGINPPLRTTDGGATWQAAAGGRQSAWTAAAGLLGLPLATALAGRYPQINTPITGGAVGPNSAWMTDALALYAGATWTRYKWPPATGGPGAISFAAPDDGWMITGDDPAAAGVRGAVPHGHGAHPGRREGEAGGDPPRRGPELLGVGAGAGGWLRSPGHRRLPPRPRQGPEGWRGSRVRTRADRGRADCGDGRLPRRAPGLHIRGGARRQLQRRYRRPAPRGAPGGTRHR